MLSIKYIGWQFSVSIRTDSGPTCVWLPTDSYPFILFPASNWIVLISFMYWNGSRNGVRCLKVQEFLPMAKCTIQKQDTKHLASRTKINDLTTIFLPLWSNWVFRKMPFPEKKKKILCIYYHLTAPLAMYAEADIAHLRADSTSELHIPWFKMQFSIWTEWRTFKIHLGY